jgi:3-oxoadipate enol-lactonase
MPCEVHYELTGPDGAPVVVLTGSLGSDLSMWDPQMPTLSRRFRVLRYDLRGHGASPVPAGPYSIADLGADLLALLDRLEIERASLVGVSIGGMTSLWTASHAPARVQRMVVCCSSAYLDPEGSYRARAASVRELGIEPIADAVLARWFTPGYTDAHPELDRRMRTTLVGTPREGYAGCCEAIAAMDLRADLAAITAPTLVIAGADDPATPPEHGQLIADGIPSGRLTVVPAAAHLANIEQAERVNELIVGHLQSTEEEPG